MGCLDSFVTKLRWCTLARDVYKPHDKSNEIEYGIVEKEVLALIRILDICYTILITSEVKVLTRYSTLAGVLQFFGLNEHLG